MQTRSCHSSVQTHFTPRSQRPCLAEKALLIWPYMVKPLTPCPFPGAAATLASGGLLNTPGEGLGAFVPGVRLDSCLPSNYFLTSFLLHEAALATLVINATFASLPTHHSPSLLPCSASFALSQFTNTKFTN